MTLVKICGLSTEATLDAALDAGADMVGLVFFPKSPRNVSIDRAAILASRARGKAEIVALVVDANDTLLAEIAATVRPDLFQFHGHETAHRIAAERARHGLPVMKAVAIADAADVARARTFAEVADRLLLDAKPPKTPQALPGGNGLAFDWRLVAGLDPPLPFMLSGGLTPETVAAAIGLVKPEAVDVSSGVESAPGVKDPARIEAFVRAVRAADGA